MNQAATRTTPILKIEGPPGSGKTRELAREACRLIVSEGLPAEKILILAVSNPVRNRLMAFLKEEARLAGIESCNVEVATWEDFMIRLVQGPNPSEETEVFLLPEPDARVLLHRILSDVVQPQHPLYHASRQLSFSRVLFELIRQLQLHQASPENLRTLAASQADSDSRLPLVAEIYERFLSQTANRGLLCHADLMHRAAKAAKESEKVRQWLGNKYPVIMSDDAQELSEPQHRLLMALPCRLILSGNEKLSIRHFRGAAPEMFGSLTAQAERPVTFNPKQTCMRGNETVLSLLNHLLPQPIWEAQAQEPERLRDAVTFGFYPDPELEAEGLVTLLKQTVRERQVDGCLARWEDCVILLRTGHYKHHLMSALIQAGIPFRTEIFTDNLIRFQHIFYDLLHVLESLRILDVSADKLRDADFLRRQLNSLAMPSGDKLAWLQKSNRYLRRFLEAVVEDEGAAFALRHLQVTDPENPQVIDLLFAVLAGVTQASPLSPALTLIEGYYRDYKAQPELLPLFSHASERFLSGLEPDELKDIGEGLRGFSQNLERLDAYYRTSFGHSLSIPELLGIYHTLWDGIEASAQAGSESDGRVTIRSLHQMQGLEAPFVFIPFVVGGEFPLTRENPELLSAADQSRLGIDIQYRINEAEEARLLAVGMSRATERVVLTCHQADSSLPVPPSPFYLTLVEAKREILGHGRQCQICWCQSDNEASEKAPCGVDYCMTQLQVTDAVDEDFFSRYSGESAWAQLEKSVPEPLFNPEETVYLSASSIKTYMTCPRQFYYRHLLRLPLPGSEAATLGSLIHRLMEIFNASTENYTARRLEELANIMFRFEEEPDAFIAAGFDEKDRLVLARLSPLSFSSLRQRLMESIADLERKGYFARYGNLKAVEAEKQLDSFALEGIDGCRFSGVIDALIQLEDGSWEIVDYKTFQAAYSTGLDTCDKHFRSTLDPVPNDEELSHRERFWAKLNHSYPKDYQLPLYYLACSDNPIYRDRLRSVSLQIIRPAFADNDSQGAIRLEIPGTEIEACKQQMLSDINGFIVQPILGSKAFETNPDRSSCGQCGYYGICGDALEGEEAGGEG